MKLSEWIKKYGDCEITEEMEKCIKKKKGKWMPEKGEFYYFINDHCCMVTHSRWDGDKTDNYRRDFMRIFKTLEEAERYLGIMKACKEVSFEPDWDDYEQGKYYFQWLHGHSKLEVNKLYTVNEGHPFYFKYEEVAKRLMYVFGEKDIAKYVLGVEVE